MNIYLLLQTILFSCWGFKRGFKVSSQQPRTTKITDQSTWWMHRAGTLWEPSWKSVQCNGSGREKSRGDRSIEKIPIPYGQWDTKPTACDEIKFIALSPFLESYFNMHIFGKMKMWCYDLICGIGRVKEYNFDKAHFVERYVCKPWSGCGWLVLSLFCKLDGLLSSLLLSAFDLIHV